MIKKNIQTPHGDCTTTSTVSHLDNGQAVFKIVSELDGHKHEHTVTVGSVDGKDALPNLSDDQLKQTLQSHLDQVRQQAVDILAARSKVKKFAAELV